jgi:hypothetical protein
MDGSWESSKRTRVDVLCKERSGIQIPHGMVGKILGLNITDFCIIHEPSGN